MAAIALLLLSVLTLTSVSALNTATVVSSVQTITVTSTETAMVELDAGDTSANAGGIARTADGNLVLNFTKSGGTTGYGFPVSDARSINTAYTNTVTYKNIFTITNASQDSLCLYVYVPGGGVPDLNAIVLRSLTPARTQTTAVPGGGKGSSCLGPVAPGQSVAADFYWSITSAAGSTFPDFNVRVEGSRTP
jgi:hypothetical protein